MGHRISEARLSVLETVPKDRRSFDTFLTRLLRPLFDRLPREVQLRLVRETMIDATVAHMLAKERLGEAGNVRVDGDECQIGLTTKDGDFAILSRGLSWDAAWDALAESAR